VAARQHGVSLGRHARITPQPPAQHRCHKRLGSPQLSPREREIVQLVAEGKSNKEVASALVITIKTVATYRAHIMAKLDLHSTDDLVRYATRSSSAEYGSGAGGWGLGRGPAQ